VFVGKNFMSLDRSKLSYRLGTQAFIVNGTKILIAQEIRWKDNEWGFPGGKIEDNETSEMTIARELKEEFPENTFKIIKRCPIELKYEWPDEIVLADIKMKGWAYRGQIRQQFLVHLNESDIVSYKADELKNIQWVEIADLDKYLIFPGQLEKTMISLKSLGVV
jgi:8-oxo-dGTP pyrophosphatase MutT (NUDIX family)